MSELTCCTSFNCIISTVSIVFVSLEVIVFTVKEHRNIYTGLNRKTSKDCTDITVILPQT